MASRKPRADHLSVASAFRRTHGRPAKAGRYITLATIAFAIATLRAQTADEVSRLEQQGKRAYSSAYRGITATGQYETAEDARTRDSGRRQEVRVELRGSTAIVTGIENAGGAGDRVLRIWVKDGDKWQIVAGQTTWIGARTDVPDPSGPSPA